uniref:Uncharacterized protein n=1 Tax=Timema douglasi TaxID=61478 RepID=A0A7R8VZF5_TIMDO|nr:unnamed protein product [Timema douglasi]
MGSQFLGTDPFYSTEHRRRNLCTTCNEEKLHPWSLGRQIHHFNDNHGVWVVRSTTSLAKTSCLGPKDKSGSSELKYFYLCFGDCTARVAHVNTSLFSSLIV